MAELKTKKNAASVEEFLQAVPEEGQRADAFRVLEILREVTGEEPAMWGTSIVGFGQAHYKYASGREGDWFLAGFSPRKGNLTLYFTSQFEKFAPYLERLGKHKTGVGCLYIKRLADVDEGVLRELVAVSLGRVAGQ